MKEANPVANIFWMRQISLTKARDITLMVAKYGPLSYTEISRLGIQQEILVQSNGKVLGKSHIYRYIRIPEKLGLLSQNNDKKYRANVENVNVAILLADKRFPKTLDKDEKLAYQKLIVNNQDCRDSFLWIFMGTNNFTWEDFIKKATPVSIKPFLARDDKSFWTKEYLAQSGNRFILDDEVKREAIEWGLQLWLKDLSLVDEIYVNESKHILYPVDLTKSLSFSEFLMAFTKIKNTSVDSEWNIFPVNQLAFELAPLFKVPLEELQNNFFIEAGRRYPGLVKYSSSSQGALTFRSKSLKTDAKMLKSFFKSNNEWITHILVHRNIWEVNRDGNAENKPATA